VTTGLTLFDKEGHLTVPGPVQLAYQPSKVRPVITLGVPCLLDQLLKVVVQEAEKVPAPPHRAVGLVAPQQALHRLGTCQHTWESHSAGEKRQKMRRMTDLIHTPHSPRALLNLINSHSSPATRILHVMP
jgi:hypothetical protein